MKNWKFIFITLGVLITVVIFLSPYHIESYSLCKCGGCCDGCPGNCKSIGAPFAYFYWGDNMFENSELKFFSLFGLVTNILTWISILLILLKIKSKYNALAK